MIAVVLAAVTALGAPSAPPPTIPAIRQWRPAEGSFRLTAASRIVGDRLPEAAMLARELGRPVAARPPAPGDVELALGSGDRALGAEGYRLEVGRTVRIEARTRAGVFHGTRTLLQLLRSGPAIPAGRARDWPTYPERGLMIDNGRRYFAPAWIKRRIRELAYLKLNQLHLHFSDDQGFRIESSRHPEVVSAQHLTKRQVRDIVAYARDRHVRVIGELDMPGHLRAALRRHPELQLRSAEGVARPDKLDISKPAARRFARDLILEYLDLFPGRYWHAGADEYLAPGEYADYPQLKGGRAAYLRFVRWLDRLVHANGRTLRVWHDGLSGARLPRRVVVEWWTDHAGPPPARLLADGHRVLNAGWWPTYYVVSPLGVVRPSMELAYDSWQVNAFGGISVGSPAPLSPPQVVRRHRDRILGSELHVWNDDPRGETRQQTARAIAPRLRVLAQKTWDTPAPASGYAEFERLWNRVRP